MKNLDRALNKKTGAIVYVEYIGNGKYSDGQKWFEMDELDFDLDDHDLRQEAAGELEMIGKRVAAGLGNSSDYWTRLEHRAAIAAMQGILSDPVLLEATLTNANKFDLTGPQAVAIDAYHYAHALVEKYKKEE